MKRFVHSLALLSAPLVFASVSHAQEAPVDAAPVDAAPADAAPADSAPADAAPADAAPADAAPADAGASSDPARTDPAPLSPEQGRVGWSGTRVIAESDWRQSVRRAEGVSSYPWFDAEHFVFEIRFGPYYAEVDEEPALGGSKPFETYFGEEARLYFGLEVDWVPLRVPYVASLGIGAGWGYTRFGGTSFTPSADGGASSLGTATDSETGLNIFPMHLSAVARFDGLLREFGLPVVPYIKGGLGLGYWSAVGASGTSESEEGTSTVIGEGVSTGTHLAIGGAIALNAFDRAAASNMRAQSGLRYAYIFGEWMRAELNGLGDSPAMHVGDSTGVFGVALEW